MKKQLITLLLFVVVLSAQGQFERFGIKAGPGLSNQYMHTFTFEPGDISYWNDNKPAWSAMFFLEKDIGKTLVLQPAIGYIQKGYALDHRLIHLMADSLTVKSDQVVIHNISLDLSLRWNIKAWPMQPYIIGGLRLNHKVGDRYVIVNYQGVSYEVSGGWLHQYNKTTVGALIGFGVHVGELLQVEFEFNPDFTKSLRSHTLLITNQYAGINVGIFLQDLVKKLETNPVTKY